MVDGIPVWPEQWGITRDQLEYLLHRLRAEPSWKSTNSVYTLVADYIVPWTRGGGIGYALGVNRNDPKGVTVMVSHAWAENAEEFLETLLRTVSRDEALFICALSLYQVGDGCGPSIVEQLGSDAWESPFHRVLAHIQACGRDAGWYYRWGAWLEGIPPLGLYLAAILFLLPAIVEGCAPTLLSCAAMDKGTWKWRPLGPWAITSMALVLPLSVLSPMLWLWLHKWRLFRGRMIVMPNREVDIYSRLWCVYEMFVCSTLEVRMEIAKTLALAGTVSSRYATCSSVEDTERILGEVEARTNFRDLDRIVYMTTHGAWWKTLRVSMSIGSLIACCDIVVGSLMDLSQPRLGDSVWLHVVPLKTEADTIVFAVTVFIAKNYAWIAMFSIFASSQGLPSRRAVACRAATMCWVGSPFVLAGAFLSYVGLLSDSQATSVVLVGTTIILYAFFFFCVALLTFYFPRHFQFFGRLRFILPGVTVIFVLLSVMQVWRHHVAQGAVHFYPILLSSALCTFGSFFLPAFLFWYGAFFWGMRMSDKGACCGAFEEASRSDSQSEEVFWSGSDSDGAETASCPETDFETR